MGIVTRFPEEGHSRVQRGNEERRKSHFLTAGSYSLALWAVGSQKFPVITRRESRSRVSS